MSEKTKIETVSFVGSGNVATHLAIALQKAGICIKTVYSPNKQNAAEFANRFGCEINTSLEEVGKDVDMLILAIPDSKVEMICNTLKDNNPLVVHTSGITPMDVLQSKNRYGVFYPLQTFSKEREVDMKKVPFCLEANNKEDLDLMFDLAQKLSSNVQFVDSKKESCCILLL